MVSELEKDLRTDPVGRAETDGIVQATPLDLQSSDALVSTLGPRYDAAKAAADHYGVPVKLFKPDEIQALKAGFQQGGDQALGIAGALVTALGKNARKRSKNLATMCRN